MNTTTQMSDSGIRIRLKSGMKGMVRAGRLVEGSFQRSSTSLNREMENYFQRSRSAIFAGLSGQFSFTFVKNFPMLSFRNGVKLTLNYKTWYLPSSVTILQNFDTAKTIGRRAHSSQYGTETGTGTVPTTER
jgi:hypothetical protein